VALHLHKVHPFKTPLKFNTVLGKSSRPPQSFRYLSVHEEEKLRTRSSRI
jgi:hypothetical protein